VYGVVVPTPTFPFESIMKAVEVADAVEVATTNKGRFPELVEEAATDNIAHGEVVLIPTLPPPLNMAS
jgi:hypothetical protein